MSHQPSHRGRILVVEDQGIAAIDIERCLKDDGFEVTGIATSMESAIRETSKSRPDLVLMDIRIQGEADGIDTALHLRRDFGLPIIYLTAHDDPDTLARAKRTEPMAFLMKPFKPAELTSAVEIALNRSRMERQVRERERSFLSAMDTIGDAVLTSDAQGHVRFMNRAAEELTGWRQELALGRLATDVVHVVNERDSERLCALLNLHSASGPDSSNLYRVLARNGAHHWLKIKVTSLAGAGDSSIRVVVMQDVTESERSKQALRRQADLLDQSRDAIFTWDMEGAISYWNRGAQALYGFSPAEALGRTVRELLPAAHPRVQEALDLALARDGQWSGELTRKTRDGREIVVESLLVASQDATGRKTVLETNRDITERKQAEETRAWLASLVESSDDAIIGKTPEGIIISWNRGAEAIYGYAASEVLGKSISILAPPDRPDEVPQILERIRRGERVPHFRTVRVRKDGATLVMALTVSPIWNGAGHVVGAATIARDISQHERAEEALRRSEEKYRSLVDNIPDVIWTADATGMPMFISDNIERIYGYTSAELCQTGGVWFDRIHPHDAASVQAAFIALVTRGEPFEAEYRIQRRDGRWIWLHGEAICRYQKDGKLYIDGIASDITERKQAEQALQDSEEKYRSLVLHIPDIVWSAGADGRIAYVSPNVDRLLSFTAADAYRLGSPVWFDAVHPDDAPRVKEAFELLFANGQAYDVECRVRSRSGEWIWVHDRAVATYERNGMRYADGLVSDISARKRAQEAVRTSEERYRLLFERNLAGVVRARLDGDILECNEAFAKILGYASTAQVSALSTADLYYSAGEQAPLVQALKAQKALTNREMRFRRSDGSPVWAIVNLTLIEDIDCTGLVEATIVDITNQKRVEEELILAKEAAEAASRAKSDFVANMSHEIRTPMNGVLGMTELALDTSLTAEQRDYLNTVKSSADALLCVINDILDFSKIEARKLDLECVAFDLRACVEGTLKALGVRAAQKEIELACHVAPDIPHALMGDPVRIRQVLMNLAGNAVKFTERGEVVVEVGKLDQANGQVTVQFSVRDTGIGIPQAQQQAIYQAFVQADASHTRRFGGTGLGLAIASQLVGMMGGHIQVESEVGKGATFYFTVRLGIAFSTPEEPPRATLASLFRTCVLLVDDHATNRRILGQMMNNWGMQPSLAGDGQAGLDALKQAAEAGGPFPLVIVDSHMPGMDGFDLIEQIRQDPQLAATNIMMLTSAGRRGEAARCRDLGVSAYLTKPVGEAELLEAVLRVLGIQATRAATPQLITEQSLIEPRKSLKILIAEDNPVNQRLAVRLVEKQGCSASTAANGREALEALEKEHFDLVLMDVQMPEMDGLEATRAIRQKEAATGAHVPIIAMTAHAMQQDRTRCLEAGMDAYVPKPVQVRDLATAIQSAVPRLPKAPAKPLPPTPNP